ncbi:flagellar motor protein MotB [Pseudomonas fluorescens]|uniref:OmpA family protein n=1 Tax=Pseudomonas lactucae TaxID=2813360 RepID=UPI0009994CF7|nr:OmpA family protein [Pseudomonas lactucae]MBN2986414.1 OmpA family protein [Pseudomonas lactucae]OPA94337.1 flagellar motor protein MotB [Pseudomonas fluorescens]OPB13157.1 flagellar motor protein MotB [Pseudomonas fluorescens]OPB24262.1 flagellar motor protein MotB [Pseudomonas fluorescens]
MTFNLHRILCLWAGALVLALLAILPLAMWVRVFGVLIAVYCVAWAWISLRRRVERLRGLVRMADNMALPAASFRHPVVLVCGDGLEGLFGAVPTEQLTLRVTEQGCYVRVPSLEQLPTVTDSVLALRPGWGGQLGVMFAVNPGAHSDGAVLAGQVRAFKHQVALARKRGIALPLLLVSYLQTLHGEAPWFSWNNGQAHVRVRDAGACVGLDEWQQQTTGSSIQAARMHASIQLNSIVAWLHDAVLPHLCTRSSPGLATICAVKLVPALPHAVKGSLWQQWLRSRVAVVDNRPVVMDAVLPFPDPVLSLLPLGPLRSPVHRASVIALWLFAVAGVVALASSAWQNTLLVRQVSDDLRRYAAIPQPTQREQRQFLWREDAVTILRQDAQRLDAYYRHGVPLAFGLGLYRGERLRAPLLAVLAAHVEPPSATPPTRNFNPVRLDSLSLFATGSAQLKPGSTKILINALVDIKAQPGWLIVIAGHTDATGDPQNNLRLSRARAAAVHAWMQQMGGIPDSCFAVQGFGASQPIARNDTEAGRAANRRVDIRLVPEAGACALSTAGPDRQPPVASRDS